MSDELDGVDDFSPGDYRIPDEAIVLLEVLFVDEPGGYGARIVGCIVEPPKAVAMLRSLADQIEREIVPRYLGELS